MSVLPPVFVVGVMLVISLLSGARTPETLPRSRIGKVQMVLQTDVLVQHDTVNGKSFS